MIGSALYSAALYALLPFVLLKLWWRGRREPGYRRRIGERFGARTGIFIAIAVYMGICLWGYRLQHLWEFYALATAIGLVQGGINSLSRSLFSRLTPPERSAQFFGFYNTVGRFSAVLGPVLMGAVARSTGSPRLSMLALTVLFAIGALFLARVRERPLSSA